MIENKILLSYLFLLFTIISFARDGSPKISPDGNYVVFHSDRRDSNWEVYIVNIDGSGLKRLTNFEGRDVNPGWSPDGKRIVYASGSDMSNWEIYTMNTEGKDVKRLTDLAGREMHPNWSPNGKKIAFISNRDGNFDLYTMNTDGSDQKKVIQKEKNDFRKFHPSWSKDSKELFFDGGDEDGIISIYKVQVNGTGLKQITFSQNRDAHACFSNNEKRIYFSRFYDDGDRVISSVDYYGENRIDLKLEIEKPGNPSFPEDESVMVFTGNKDGKQNIYKFDMERKQIGQITFD